MDRAINTLLLHLFESLNGIFLRHVTETKDELLSAGIAFGFCIYICPLSRVELNGKGLPAVQEEQARNPVKDGCVGLPVEIG